MDVRFIGRILPRERGQDGIGQGVLRIMIDNKESRLDVAGALKDYKHDALEIHLSDDSDWTSRMNRLFHGLVRHISTAGQVQYWEPLGRAPANFDEVKAWVKVVFAGAKIEKMGEFTWIESWSNFKRRRALQAIDSVLNYCSEVGLGADEYYIERNALREDLKDGDNS